MTFSPYSRAVTAAKEAVIEALRIDENTSVLSELWRHYLGLRSIEENNQHTDLDDNIPFGAAGDSPIGYDAYFGTDPFTTEPVAAGAVNIPGSAGQDVITFN